MQVFEKTNLAPPGAGLPRMERVIAMLLLSIRCRTGNRESFTADFKSERSKIRILIDSHDSEVLSQRVLIVRPRGIEDSSRDWSVLMTVDHLRIVNQVFAGIIHCLSNGIEPPEKASTATVKPSPLVSMDVIVNYESSCDALLEAVEAISNLKTKTRYQHPWFWKMDAHEWHALAASHMAIHRVQIERILASC